MGALSLQKLVVIYKRNVSYLVATWVSTRAIGGLIKPWKCVPFELLGRVVPESRDTLDDLTSATPTAMMILVPQSSLIGPLKSWHMAGADIQVHG